MAAVTLLHVPECQGSGCKPPLRQLMAALEASGFTIAKYPMSGLYSNEFNSRVKTCSYTILHRCFSLWRKLMIKGKGMDASVLKDSKKILCVNFHFDLPEVEKEPEKCPAFEDFFEDFMIQDVSDDLKLTEFVDNLKVTFQEEIKKCEPVSDSEIYFKPDIPPRPSPEYPVYQYTVLKNTYENNQFTERQIFEKLHTVQQEEAKRVREGKGKLLPYPDMFGTVSNQSVQARHYDETSLSDTLIVFNQLLTFTEMRNVINQVLKTPQRALSNVKFILHKVLPELSSSNCLHGIMTLATCDDMELQKQAITVLEQLVLKGKFSTQQTDFGMMNKIQVMLTMLTESICVVRNTLLNQNIPNLEMILQRKCTLHFMLQGELIMSCRGADDYRTLEKFNQELKLTLQSKCRETSSYSRYFNDIGLVMFLDLSLSDVQKCISSFLVQISTGRHPDLASELQGKKDPVQFYIILQLLKKAFLKKDLHSLEFIKAYLAKTKAALLKLLAPSVPPPCFALLIRLLVQLLNCLSRDCAYKDLSKICPEITQILRSCKKKDPRTYDDAMPTLQALMFRQTPSVRNCVIDLFKAENLYPDSFDMHLVQAVKSSLSPVLVLDHDTAANSLQSHDREMKFTNGWITLFGSFQVHSVSVVIHVPTEADHRQYNKKSTEELNDRLWLNQIEMLRDLSHEHIITLFAYNITHMPQFYVMEDYKQEGNDNFQEYLVHLSINKTYLPEATLLNYLFQAASALEYCHSKGIVHRNITAASFAVAGPDCVKLSGFHLSFFLKPTENEKVLVSEDNCKIPTRWSAPESLRRCKWSKKTDIWMFGHLCFEVRTHGVLPYSHLELSDADFVTGMFKSAIDLKQEMFITDVHFNEIISACVTFNSCQRATISKIKSRLSTLSRECSSVVYGNYPDLQNGLLKPSTAYHLGIPNVDYDYFMRNKPKSCTKPTDNLRLSRMGDEYLIKELVDRKFTKELVQQVNNGALDYLLPFLHINTETQTIEIQLPYAKIICLLDLVSQKPNCKIQSLIHKLALMVDRIHKLGFVLGDIRASLIFVNSESEDEMKFHPVSLAFINYVVDKRRPVKFSKPKDPVTLARAAPEVIEYGHYSFASDVYNFAVLIHELYDTPIKADAMHYVNDRLAKLIEGEIKIKELKKPTAMSGKLFQLTRRCLDPDPSERPQVVDLLNFFSIDTAVSRRSQFMDDSSSDVYPRDNETGNSEEENPRPQRSRPNSRPRTPTQQDNNLTNNLSFNLINPSQTDSDCETDLYNQNASCQRTRLFRKKGFYLKSKETSIANRNSYPSRPRSTALKNRISVGTEGHANVTESGDSGAEGCEGGAEGCTFVPAYEDMTDSDKYDDILGNPTPTVRNVLFRTSESVSGIGVDPRVARQGHYDSDSSLDVGHSDYSEINEENQTIPEEEQDVYEMY